MAPQLRMLGALPSQNGQLGMSLPLQALHPGWGLAPSPALPGAFLTHVTLVLPAVLPLLVGIAHAAVAVDVDITWRSEGLSQGAGLLGRGGRHPVFHHHPQGGLRGGRGTY